MRPNPNVVALIGAMREARFVHGLTCVHCNARCIQRWGTFSGRQRYRCGVCLRTFSDLTKTAASYLKKVEQLAEYARHMPDARSVRYEGRRMEIDKDTALRWRHRLLAHAPRHGELTTSGIQGIVEVAESRFTCVRRPRARWWEPDRSPPITILVLRDRRRLTYQERCFSWRVRTSDFEAVSMMLTPGSTIVTAAGVLNPIATAVRRRRMEGAELFFRAGYRGGHAMTGLYHTRNVADFIRREKRWLKRFRGISRRWVREYLTWFEMVDPETRGPTFDQLLRWPLLRE